MNTILQFYSTIPYHNAPHAQFVRANLIQMGISDRVSLLSAEGHDALHTGTPRSGDEEISALMTARIGVLHGLINPRE